MYGAIWVPGTTADFYPTSTVLFYRWKKYFISTHLKFNKCSCWLEKSWIWKSIENGGKKRNQFKIPCNGGYKTLEIDVQLTTMSWSKSHKQAQKYFSNIYIWPKVDYNYLDMACIVFDMIFPKKLLNIPCQFVLNIFLGKETKIYVNLIFTLLFFRSKWSVFCHIWAKKELGCLFWA